LAEFSTVDRTTFSGLATGLDTSALVEALMAIERRPLNSLEDRRTQIESQRAKFRELNTKLLALRDAARALDNRISSLSADAFQEEFLAWRATTSDEKVVRATATAGASPGIYDLTVDRLATVQRELSQAFASSSDPLAGVSQGDTLTIHFSDPGAQDVSITVGAGGVSLVQLRDAINLDAENAGRLQAEILFDGSQYRLVLSGTRTGVANAFVLSGAGGLAPAAWIDPSLGQAATDAQVTVLKVPITSSTNTIENAFPGLTLELVAKSDPGPEKLTVTLDREAMEKALQGFVDAYNGVAGLIAEQLEVDDEGKASGALFNSPLLRSVQGRLQGLASARYLTGLAPLSPFSSLSEIGIHFDRKGKLSLDSEELEAALAKDVQAVRRLLGGDPELDDGATPAVEGDGVATAIARALAPLVQLGDGILALQDQNLDQQIEGLRTQIERFEKRLEGREETLLAQFSRLEAAVSALQSQSAFLTAIQTFPALSTRAR
jgi:flagellar hook-associated protein 2